MRWVVHADGTAISAMMLKLCGTTMMTPQVPPLSENNNRPLCLSYLWLVVEVDFLVGPDPTFL